MKILSLIFTTFIATSSFAAAVQNTFHSKIVGRVLFDQGQTMTCLATNCPPSVSYFQLILDDVQIEGVGAVETVLFQDFDKVRTHQKPEAVVYGGVTLTEGMYVIVQADVRLVRSGEKVYAIATNPAQIKLATIRHPVMLY